MSPPRLLLMYENLYTVHDFEWFYESQTELNLDEEQEFSACISCMKLYTRCPAVFLHSILIHNRGKTLLYTHQHSQALNKDYPIVLHKIIPPLLPFY